VLCCRERLENAFRTRSNSNLLPRPHIDSETRTPRSRSESMDAAGKRKDSKYNLKDKDTDINPKLEDKDKDKEKDKEKGFSLVKEIEIRLSRFAWDNNSKPNGSKKKDDREVKIVKSKKKEGSGSGRLKGKSFLSLGKSGGKKVCTQAVRAEGAPPHIFAPQLVATMSDDQAKRKEIHKRISSSLNNLNAFQTLDPNITIAETVMLKTFSVSKASGRRHTRTLKRGIFVFCFFFLRHTITHCSRSTTL